MTAALRYARLAMREQSSPWIARGYLELLRDELHALQQKRQRVEPAETVPVHRALVASLNRAQLGQRLLEVADCVLILDRHLAAEAADAATPWLEDACLLAARINGEERRRSDARNH